MTIFRFSIFAAPAVSLAQAPLAAQELDDDAKLARADKQLNQLYQARMRALLPAGKTTLRSFQRAWLSAATKRCTSIADGAAEQATAMGPGAAAQFAKTSCLLDLTKKRVVVLRNWKAK